MSEPVTNAEVEDVLSSIRRLVSEEKRPLQASPAAPEEGQGTSSAASKQPEPPARASAENPQPAETDAGESSYARGQERPFASSRRPMTPPQPDASQSAADRLVLTPALRVTRPEPQDEAQDRRQASAPSEEAKAPPVVSPYDYDMLHDDPDDLQADDYAAEAPEAAQVAEPQEEVQPPSDSAEPAPAFVHSRAREGASRSENAETPRPSPLRLSEKVAALETAIGNISEQWEPDSPGDGDYSGTEPPAMAWEDDVEAEAAPQEPSFGPDDLPRSRGQKGEPEAAAPDLAEQVRRFADSGPRTPETARPAAQPTATAEPATEDGTAALGGEDQFLDEEALRDLVTEIVRAELQGALGERITRNVRKLVRREIHRAMTAQDLE